MNKLKLAIEVLQRYGKQATIIADKMFKERDWERDEFFRELEKRLKEKI